MDATVLWLAAVVQVVELGLQGSCFDPWLLLSTCLNALHEDMDPQMVLNK